MTYQIPLEINLRDDATLESFYPGDNDNLIDKISNFINNNDISQKILVLTGARDSGKTHLLQASCVKADEYGITSVYLPLQQMKNNCQQYLEGLDSIKLVCIDDIETIVGDSKVEAALLEFLISLESKGGRALLAISDNYQSLGFINKQLLDKLSASYNQPLERLNSEQILAALLLRSNIRGIGLDDRVAKFLIRNHQNNLTALFMFLEKLDTASLAEKRRLTIPFVKDVLELGL